MRRASPIICLFGLLLAPAAAAKPPPAPVKIGNVALTPAVNGRSSLLVEVAYPIALSGRRLSLRVFALDSSGATVESWRLHPLANAGPPRAPTGQRRFRFVHRIGLSRRLTGEAASGLRLRLQAIGFLDTNGDGEPELIAGDGDFRTVTSAAKPRGICASVSQLRSRPGRRVVVAIPVCDVPERWLISDRPGHGRARIRGGKLIYRPAKGFRGTDSLMLAGAPRRGEGMPAGTMPLAVVPVVIKVGAAPKTVVRAMGDSVTAGFGYYSDGKLMPLVSLPECKPGSTKLVDACSSNSTTLDDEAREVEYAPDYGLANDVSWAAQWANEYGIVNYENLAISGSEPADWAPWRLALRDDEADRGRRPRLHPDDDRRQSAALGNAVRGRQHGLRDLVGPVRQVRGMHRRSVCRGPPPRKPRTPLPQPGREDRRDDLPDAVSPLDPLDGARIHRLPDRRDGQAAEPRNRRRAPAVNPHRLQVVTPPHFNVGVDISPVYPSRYSCSRLGYEVDGPSVQIEATQDELLISHPLSFCSGPVHGPPWVISGDTGIHPSAAGYAQMASQVPAPG